MLEMWSHRTFPCKMSFREEKKTKICRARGACSASDIRALETHTEVRRIGTSGRNRFCFCGLLNGQTCNFRVDTGSDVSLMNEKFVDCSQSKDIIGVVAGNCHFV